MDGVHPPRCVEWRWCVLLLSCPVRWCGSCPAHPVAVLASTAVVSCTVRCQCVVCGWWVCVCAVRVVGYPLSAPPSSLWVVGAVVGEGRLCCRPPCLVCGVPLLRVGVPLVVYPVALLNGGVVCAVVPCLRIGSGALHCPIPSCIVLFPLVLSSSPSLFVFVVTVLLV